MERARERKETWIAGRDGGTGAGTGSHRSPIRATMQHYLNPRGSTRGSPDGDGRKKDDKTKKKSPQKVGRRPCNRGSGEAVMIGSRRSHVGGAGPQSSQSQTLLCSQAQHKIGKKKKKITRARRYNSTSIQANKQNKKKSIKY